MSRVQERQHAESCLNFPHLLLSCSQTLLFLHSCPSLSQDGETSSFLRGSWACPGASTCAGEEKRSKRHLGTVVLVLPMLWLGSALNTVQTSKVLGGKLDSWCCLLSIKAKPNSLADHHPAALTPYLSAAPAPVSFLIWAWGGKGGGRWGEKQQWSPHGLCCDLGNARRDLSSEHLGAMLTPCVTLLQVRFKLSLGEASIPPTKLRKQGGVTVFWVSLGSVCLAEHSCVCLNLLK